VSSRADRLQPVVDLAGERAEAATRDLAEHQRQLAGAEGQLDELRRYREDYGSVPDGVGVAALLNRQQFLHRIDQAIVQQLNEVDRRKTNLALAQKRWTDARSRAKALESVTTRYREVERKTEDRREQEQADERSQYRRPSRISEPKP
jgi:flagellar FliJ protein